MTSMAVHMSVDFKSLSEIIGLQCRVAIVKIVPAKSSNTLISNIIYNPFLTVNKLVAGQYI